MIEIYLFVNPLGSICLDIEREILTFAQAENRKIQLRLIPLVNMKTIDFLLKVHGIHPSDIKGRNQLFETTYSAALDFKAAQLQGKKKGRHILLNLQSMITESGVGYSPDLAETLIVDAGGDLEMFKNDRKSSFVKESFQIDQQIAREMGVTQHPSTVIYNYACDRDYGVLVEGDISIQQIERLCETSEKNYLHFHDSLELADNNEQSVPKGHLHLL
ncbi:DsbA family protein [Enterococcus sp. BWB1-3]|uniref:DsbA family protein n=1 Tax=unclassified Enterococcus TaxID=2608891 RepID=UPI001922C62F|nr:MULTISPECIES: DsbA family protein [unclassified Enterococcus]MBL1229779.1 DsbA family protein [Enterococcus sp. BWB1-3]MCB5953014.1 DsbA family protein [Enterococcus sp. BWT-B8]MCB5956277.1 DsbA family protein [Enterococcus sp. CWB-B31]